MTAAEGLELCQRAQPSRIVPVHYEGWSHFRDGRAGVERALRSAPAYLRERLQLVDIGIGTEVAA